MPIDLSKHTAERPHYTEQQRRMEPVLIWRDCYHLLAVFSASPALHRESRYVDIARDWEETEANRLLLSAAVLTRDSMDTAFAQPTKKEVRGGKLIKNRDALPLKEVGLSEREACNKIIHATVVRFGRDEDGSLNGEVFLWGDLREATWVCGFLVADFVDALREHLNL